MAELVGILNVTPDSFSDGNLFFDAVKAIEHARQMFGDGAALVDVGAESTRPKATPLTPEQEWQRLEPVLTELVRDFPGRISVDTYHPETAEKALELSGDVIINDITGMNDPAMRDVVAKFKARCIISELPGGDIQAAHASEPVNDALQIKKELLARAAGLEAMGVPKANIILDPGIGFGKTMALNRKLLEFPKLIKGYKVMIGYSRKRFLGEHRMEIGPNLEAARIAIAAGAAYLRVHDVAGHRQLLK
ncbi:MAG TPA: dihydropteroate synthase [Candidatus Saccharimonadia bacterium]|nr:dihydropteroate synthase [Candidatus Saccharimonadia bacterium]